MKNKSFLGWMKNMLRYFFYYNKDERWIFGVILWLALLGTIIYIPPLFNGFLESINVHSIFGFEFSLLDNEKKVAFFQGLGDKFFIFLLTTVTLTIFLKRFFDDVDRKKFYANLRLLCVSHKMHELIFFCLEYFDKLSSVLKLEGENTLRFDFYKDVVLNTPSLKSRIGEQMKVKTSVNDFWHTNWFNSSDPIRKSLHNQDWFYRGRKDKSDKNGGRYKFGSDRAWNRGLKIKLQDIRDEREAFIELVRKRLLGKEGVLKKSIDKLRTEEISKIHLRDEAERSGLQSWYCGSGTVTEAKNEAKNDNIVGFISYIRDDIYKKIYTYSDRKSADGMDAFLRLTTVLDRIDWKIHMKNKGETDYAELFLGLEDDFIYLLAIAVEIYSIDEIFLESYASYEKLLLAPEK